MADEKRLMTVSIEVDGEFITTKAPVDAIVRASFDDDGHLLGLHWLVQE